MAIAVLTRYAAVGIGGAASYYVLLLGMVELLGITVMIATSIAFVLVVLQNYVLHRKWTFRSDAPHGTALPLFLGMSLAGFAINWSLMHLGVQRLFIDYRLVQGVAIVAVVVWNFVISRLVIFASPINQRSSDH